MDVTEEEVMKSFAMVEAGELARPERCKRVWLGATDLEREVASSLLAPYIPSYHRAFGGTPKPMRSLTSRPSGVPASQTE